MFVITMKHDAGADGHLRKAETYDKAVDISHKFFKSYGFKVCDGKPYDYGNATKGPEDQTDSGYKCFAGVKMHNGKVAKFQHCDGDGPECNIRKVQ